MRRLVLLSLLLFATRSFAATPIILQYFGGPSEANEFALTSSLTKNVPLARAAIAGDTLHWCMYYNAGTSWTVKTNAGAETFTEGVHGTDTGVGTLDCYYLINVIGGETSIQIAHSSGSPTIVGGVGWEDNNITAHHVSGTCTTGSGALGQAAATTVTSGTTGTLASGDWLAVYTFQFSTPQVAVVYAPVTHANITWQLVHSELMFAQALMVGQYSTTTAFQPSMTQANVQTSNMCTDAFTTGTSGATGFPTSEVVAGVQAETFLNGGTNPMTLEVTPLGNTLVVMAPTGFGGYFTSVTSSPSVTWKWNDGSGSDPARCFDSSNFTETPYFYATGLTPGTTYTITVTANTTAVDTAFAEYDIAKGSTPNAGSAGTCNTGSFSAVSGNLDTSLTTGGGAATNAAFVPTSANGIAISSDSVSYDTNSGTTTSGAFVNMGYNSGATQIGNSPWYENDGDLSYPHSSTSGVAFIYTIASSPPNTSSDAGPWSSSTLDVPAASSAQVVPQVFVVQP